MNHPERIYHVSQTQLSIARHYGGITYNGKGYTYEPETDSLVRDDVLKAEAKAERKAWLAANRAWRAWEADVDRLF